MESIPELRERFTVLVIVGMSTKEHFLRSQVGIGPVRIRLFVGTVEQDLIDFRFRCWPDHLKVEKQVFMEKVYVETQQEKCWLERSEV